MPTTYTKKDGTIVKYNYYKKKEGPRARRRQSKTTKTLLKNKIQEIEDKQLITELYEVVNNFIGTNSQN